MADQRQATSARVQDLFVIFTCPRGVGVNKQHECLARVVGPDAPWKNIGTTEKPTLHQSYNCVGGCGWHGYIIDGESVDNPTVKGAAASVTTLHECTSCHHPGLLTVGITPDPKGGLRIAFQLTEVRKPVAHDGIDAGITNPITSENGPSGGPEVIQ